MRVRKTEGDLSVRVIAGTHVAIFCMDLPKTAIDGLMGFAIERIDDDGRRFFLQNRLLFKANDRGADSDHSSFHNPFQEFLWGDYTLQPEREYTYCVASRYGKPGDLSDTAGDVVELRVTTESEDDGVHAIFFNRGVAGSQRYATKFHNRKPKDVPGREAFVWLSRGLEEGLLEFIRKADGPTKGLRAAVYEFTHRPLVAEFAAAARRGADVGIVYDRVKNKENYPGDDNEALIGAEQLTSRATKRTATKIAHNKFVVLLEDGLPTEVWTGSTNFTEGALFGQSNVGHIIRDPAVAGRYLDYWTALQGDPNRDDARAWTGTNTPTPTGPPSAPMISVFSPRKGLSALEWYAKLMDEARESVFLTAAFGVSKQLGEIFARKKPYLRYLLLDKPGQVTTINRNPGNRAVAGAYLGKGDWGQWLREKLTDLNSHVRYVHTKYMLIDPLSDDPIVISGSANFSEASTVYNDENMLVIRGDTRVADIYLGEFMRLFTHFRFRAKTARADDEPIPGADAPAPAPAKNHYLRPTDAWARRFYVKNSPRTAERKLFIGKP